MASTAVFAVGPFPTPEGSFQVERGGIPLMNAAEARNSYSGSGLSIAICDTGIDYTHPKLGGGGFPNTKVIGGYDTGQDDADPMDGNGHGTGCAGIAAGDMGNAGDYIGGVYYGARLYALKHNIEETNTQERLARVLLPLGGYRKEEIRKIAEEKQLRVFNRPGALRWARMPGSSRSSPRSSLDLRWS